MTYSKDYFQLQLIFAQKISEITHQKMEDVLLQYASFYKTFGITGWDFDPNDRTWKRSLEEIDKSNDILSTIYDFYLEQLKQKDGKNSGKFFGCFSYEYDKARKIISIHFRNTDNSTPGALSKDRIKARIDELTKMFRDVNKKHKNAKEVQGFSWLYNLESYKRLFPREYTKNCKIVLNWFKSGALWGQFLDSAGELKKDLASNFINCISNKETIDGVEDCFPLKVLEPKAEIKYFYKFYGIFRA